MRVLVCGGRGYRNRELVFRTLDHLHKVRGITFLIQGVANGADYLAWQWCDERGVRCGSYPANWDDHGKAAGAIRNQEMLDEGKPDLVIAFKGGRGTADMVRRAKKAKVPVLEPDLLVH